VGGRLGEGGDIVGNCDEYTDTICFKFLTKVFFGLRKNWYGRCLN
jgi:hypothetical protein